MSEWAASRRKGMSLGVAFMVVLAGKNFLLWEMSTSWARWGEVPHKPKLNEGNLNFLLPVANLETIYQRGAAAIHNVMISSDSSGELFSFLWALMQMILLVEQENVWDEANALKIIQCLHR